MDARIVHTQHEEITVEACDDIAEREQAIVKESMDEAWNRIVPEVRCVIESRAPDSRE